MYFIYCYTNKINQHKYVGQTNNLKRRIREHRSCSYNEKSSSYNDLIHKKIREYGEENFEITTLETLYTENINKVNEREKYWIEHENSGCWAGKGYNKDLGGSRKYFTVLTQEQIEELKNKIKNGISYYDLENEYKVSSSYISSVNHGTYFYDDSEQYPLYKYYKTDEEYEELIDLLLNSDLPLSEIAKRLNLGYSTVKKINSGALRKNLYPTHPIRTKTPYETRADKIKELLLYTKLSKEQIAKVVSCSVETVRRIQVGQSFKDENLSYPLTNL